MFTTAQNFEIIRLKNNYYPQLENPLKKELNRLVVDIKDIIKSDKSIKPNIHFLNQIFNLRIKAIKWFIEYGDNDLVSMLNDLIFQVEKLKETNRYKKLAENILFALQSNQKVIQSIIETENSLTVDSSSINELQEISYEHFITLIKFSIPNYDSAKKIMEWTDASLNIEFVILAAFIINDDQLKVSNRIINELISIITDATQKYLEIAIELGISKIKLKERISNQYSLKALFGAFKSNKSPEEIISTIRRARTFNRKIEKL